MNRTRLILILMALASWALTACVPTPMFVQAYDGQSLPPAQAALLKPLVGTHIKAIDDNPSFNLTPLSDTPRDNDIDISLKPGQHSLQVGFYWIFPGFHPTVRSYQDIVISFDAKAGRKYVLQGFCPSSYSGGDYYCDFQGEILDVTDLPQYWCVACDVPWNHKVVVSQMTRKKDRSGY